MRSTMHLGMEYEDILSSLKLVHGWFQSFLMYAPTMLYLRGHTIYPPRSELLFWGTEKMPWGGHVHCTVYIVHIFGNILSLKLGYIVTFYVKKHCSLLNSIVRLLKNNNFSHVWGVNLPCLPFRLQTLCCFG